MLEKMDEFFEKRLDTYDTHMMKNIESADVFYPFTAKALPQKNGCRLLDLGCGTGLELSEYFALCPTARVTGIDLSAGMLEALKKKFPDKEIALICGSYFDVPLGEAAFDAAVSVESLHHFTQDEKLSLYKRLHTALADGGYFILTDYFAASNEEERMHQENFLALKKAEGITDGMLWHYDIPLTAAHEIEALMAAGFSNVQLLCRWGATCTIKAIK